MVLYVTNIQAQEKTTQAVISIEIGKRFTQYSKVLKEERELLIHLPESYKKSERHYPVIYVLDGNNHFEHTRNAVNLLADNNRIPESIVVAIPNNEGARTRDLARQRDRFKAYITEEVIPFITKNYRTLEHKTIFGHSMAGAFVLNYLATDTSVFDNYIVASPVVQIFNTEVITQLEELFITEKMIDKSLYMTMTDEKEEGKRATKAFKDLIQLLQQKAFKSLKWEYRFIPEQIHMTTPYLTVYEGLSRVFKDYQAPRYTSFEDFNKRGGMDALQVFYKKRGTTYQISNEVPDTVIRRLAYVLLDEGLTKQAITLFKENVANYPQSAMAFKALGDAYEAHNKLMLASKAYQKATELAQKQQSPNTNYFTRQVVRIQEKL